MFTIKIILILAMFLLEVGAASFAEKASAEISPEDMEIIQNLELLQNFEIIQSDDIALLQNYDEMEYVKTNEGTNNE